MGSAVLGTTVKTVSGLSEAQSIEVIGGLDREASLRNSPVTVLAIGDDVQADAGVNIIEGQVKLAGSVRQHADLNNSPVTALAIDSGSQASVGMIRSVAD